MLFHTDNEPDASIQDNDNIDSYNAFMENLDDGGSGEDSEGGGFGFSRFLLIAVIVLFTATFVGYCIFYIHHDARYRKLDALEPSTRTYAEFAEVFNELMEPQGIAIDVEPIWRPPAINQGLTAISVMTLPDGSQAPCGVELWGLSAKKDYILRLIILLPKEQAQYVEPVVRGGFSVFAPESNELNSEDFVHIIAASKSAFNQYPYEKNWYLISDANFTMLSEEPDYITLEWSIPSIQLWPGY